MCEEDRTTAGAAAALQECAALWSVGEIRSAGVVAAACSALVAGLDSPGLRVLAARTASEADYEVPELPPVALAELGLVFYPVASPAGREAATRALARRLLAGGLTAREFTRRLHRRDGHELPLTERLAELDDAYDILEYGDSTAAQVDAEVLAEARRLATLPDAPADYPDPPARVRARTGAGSVRRRR
ncbi:hypothetical protein AB0J21_24345 [Streptomyces sp. NPDC049954]|uniref:hypothetical protein n=1 Tax=Streptomyces sp. NPDC049954 TaxID=3155779 RepID=UPI003429FF7C